MKCFVYALRGILAAIEKERNLQFHLCAAFYVICFGFLTELAAMEWAVVLLCIGLVIALELVNTAVERACDAITRERMEEIRLAKDCVAGAVLVAAAISAVIGCVIFLPKLPVLWDKGLQTVPLVLAVPVLLYLIYKRRNRQ